MPPPTGTDAQISGGVEITGGAGAAAPGERPHDNLLMRGAAGALHGARRLAALPGAAWSRLPRLRVHGEPELPLDTGLRMRRHARVLMHALRRPLVGGNHVELLLDGPDTYAAMFDAIDAARDHINLESYIVEADGPGEELARRLL